VPQAKRVILIAGGIGVTPIKSMAHALEDAGVPFDLHYCARNASCIAFGDEFSTQWKHGKLHFHLDNGNPADGLDLVQLLRDWEEGTHVFYCGPGGFMKACAQAAVHWPAGTVHFEHFKAPETLPISSDTDASGALGSFTVKLASTGAMIDVPADRSITEALEQAGVHVETSCQSGLCGTCKLRYLEGEVDHQDFILSDEEREQWFTACVSRAKSKVLLLDL
jgi:vanillate O-demethylase ferredoxin subunit